MENTTGILHWAEEDRPREKLMLKGKSALTDAELIAILLGSGTRSMTAVDLAKSILARAGNNLNNLAKMTLNDLCKLKGIGEAKAITIISALELGRRRRESEIPRRPKITCSSDLYTLMKPHLLDLPREEFWVILLNRSNMVIKKEMISQGGISGTISDSRMIFKSAIENLASVIAVAHNHPSGNIQPSEADLKLTKNLVQAGKILDIPVIDHLIFTDHAFFSFADEGMIN
jgi:DNA repair protein RadC